MIDQHPETTYVLPHDAIMSVASMMRQARDEKWSDRKIADLVDERTAAWSRRDIELSRTLQFLQESHRMRRADTTRVRAALVSLLTKELDKKDQSQMLPIGYLAEEAANAVRWTRDQLTAAQQLLAEAADTATSQRGMTSTLSSTLVSAEQTVTELSMQVAESQGRNAELHNEALRAIGALESARIERNELGDALESARRQGNRWERQRDEWKAALGVEPGDIDTEPEQAARWFAANALRAEADNIHPQDDGNVLGLTTFRDGVQWACRRLRTAADELASRRPGSFTMEELTLSEAERAALQDGSNAEPCS